MSGRNSGNTFGDGSPIGCAQRDHRMFLQAAHDLHQRKVEGAYFHRDPM